MLSLMKRSQLKTSMQSLTVAATRPHRTRRAQGGMALMEALVAILIFSFGILGLIGLEASAINFSADSEDRNRAALFANDVASTLWLAGTVTYSAAQLATWQANVANAAASGLTNGTIAVTAVAGTTNATDITITWKPPTRSSTAANSRLVTRVILP
jgi:type IV pilus assembly protein PilV